MVSRFDVLVVDRLEVGHGCLHQGKTEKQGLIVCTLKPKKFVVLLGDW